MEHPVSAEFWGRSQPRIFGIPGAFPWPDSPWEWGLRLCERAQPFAMEAMPSCLEADGDDESELLRGRQGTAIPFYEGSVAKVKDVLLDGLRAGLAVHATVNDLGARAPEFASFFRAQFGAELDRQFRLGWEHFIFLWVSASQHTYSSHVDLHDGLLCQLAGEKQVKLWPRAPEFARAPLVRFDYAERREIFYVGEPEIHHLRPGECLHIPAGVVHEVTVPEGEKSVTVTFFAGAPYPLLSVCHELNRRAGRRDREAYTLAPAHSYVDKFRCHFLNPLVYCRPAEGGSQLPPALRSALLVELQSTDDAAATALPGLLDAWWEDALRERRFPGSEPRPMRSTPELASDYAVR